MTESQMIRVDFHLHTQYSKDSITDIHKLYTRAKKLGLGKLIITDHNTIKGAQLLQAEYPEYVVVGEEILTTRGEILAFYVQEEIPRGLEPLEAFKRLREQGAFISLSHPYAMLRHGWTEDEMLRYHEYLDAIETVNARNSRKLNVAAISFAHEHALSGTAGSDGHHWSELGRMGLELPDFCCADELRTSICHSCVFGSESSTLVHLFSREAVIVKKLAKLF